MKGRNMSHNSPEKETGRGAQMPRWFLQLMTGVHVTMNRLTGARYFNTLQGKDVCFVTMTGAKSGKERTIPLMYIPYEEGILLVASQGGAHKHPAWYYNLMKNPDIEVAQRGERMALRARLATAEEKGELWPICDRAYAPYAEYRTRTTREIPIFICEPRS
jgi:deazaflavin-dependent oxidoreductase (nitroreductase family)